MLQRDIQIEGGVQITTKPAINVMNRPPIESVNGVVNKVSYSCGSTCPDTPVPAVHHFSDVEGDLVKKPSETPSTRHSAY